MQTLRSSELSSIPSPGSLPRPRLSAVHVGVVVAYLPMLYLYARQTWPRPHYEFSPLAIVGAVVLMWLRRPRTMQPPPSGLTGIAFLLAAVACLAWALLSDSTFPIPLSVLLVIAGLGYASGGRSLLISWWPAFALLALTIRPPYALDGMLIHGLRNMTARAGSNVLDLFHVPHLLRGNIIETAERNLLVEDACSGINSLFSTLACTIFVAGIVGRNAVHTGFLCLTAFGWVFLANTLRVTLVAMCAVQWNLDLASGWRHDFLGVITYGAALGLTLSTDRFLLFLIRPRTHEIPRTIDAPAPKSRGLIIIPGGWAFVAAVAAFSFLHLVLFFPWFFPSGASDARWHTRVQGISQTLLPPEGTGWVLTEYKTETRPSESEWGQYSKVWSGRLGRSSVFVSVDYPFMEWHYLEACYASQGWSISRSQVERPENDPSGTYTELRLEKPNSLYGLLLFTEFDDAGRTLLPPVRASGDAIHRLGLSLNRRLGFDHDSAVADAKYIGKVTQLQTLVVLSTPPTTDDETAARNLFESARRAVQQHIASDSTAR